MPTLVDDARLDRMKCGEPPHNYASELSDGRVERRGDGVEKQAGPTPSHALKEGARKWAGPPGDDRGSLASPRAFQQNKAAIAPA